MSDEHQGFIKTPRQLITVVVLAFVVPIAIIVLLVKFVGTSPRTGAGADAMTPEAIEARIQPVAGFELRDASSPGALKTGEQVYKAQCSACHATGVAGAPKLGDAGAWAPRIKTGLQALATSALKGKGAMSPQGGGCGRERLEATRRGWPEGRRGGAGARPRHGQEGGERGDRRSPDRAREADAGGDRDRGAGVCQLLRRPTGQHADSAGQADRYV